MEKVKTNRKATKGRLISYQVIPENKEKSTKRKTIKHIQETPNALFRKTALFNLREKIELNKSIWHKKHPECQKKVS